MTIHVEATFNIQAPNDAAAAVSDASFLARTIKRPACCYIGA